ncbi:MAG: SDR family oxidoreductase [Dehalococcoidales bacterium]|nr:SDR family oxidoreductase [Dehalococcoidales bacterium]
MSGRLEGKIALVTGSTSGIGKAIALEFGRQGAKVVVTGRRRQLGEEVVSQLKAEGGEGAYYAVDVSSRDEVLALSRFVGENYGGLDILVNNAAPAGLAREADGRIGDTSPELWDEMWRTGLRGACLCCKYLMPYLIKSGKGSIIHMSSIQGLRGSGWDAYSMIKGGLISLTRSMAVNGGKHNVRVNAICPGAVIVERTEQLYASDPKMEQLARLQSLTRVGRPQDIAWIAVYLASDEAAYTTGEIFTIDGGVYARGRLRLPDMPAV